MVEEVEPVDSEHLVVLERDLVGHSLGLFANVAREGGLDGRILRRIDALSDRLLRDGDNVESDVSSRCCSWSSLVGDGGARGPNPHDLAELVADALAVGEDLVDLAHARDDLEVRVHHVVADALLLASARAEVVGVGEGSELHREGRLSRVGACEEQRGSASSKRRRRSKAKTHQSTPSTAPSRTCS